MDFQYVHTMQIFESQPTKTKNYGVWLRYQSRTGYHNMFKEYRDLTLNGAIEQMYTEMASRHRVRSHQIHIIKTVTIKAADCKRANIMQFHDSQIKFPVLRKYVSISSLLKPVYMQHALAFTAVVLLLRSWDALHVCPDQYNQGHK